MPKKILYKDCEKHGLTEGYIDRSKRRKNHYTRCKKCRVNNVMSSRRRRKRKLIEHFGGACIRCGYNPIVDESKSLGAIEFHHRDPKEKKFGLRDSLTRSWEQDVKEAEKCDMVCANCHRELHDEKEKQNGEVV